MSVSIQPVQRQHVREAVDMHLYVLDDEFIAMFGKSFMRVYYRAFSASSHAVALVAVDDETGVVIGGLIGTLDPSQHYRFLVRRFGVQFALVLTMHSLLHPSVGRMLVRTRLRRYVSGVMRQLLHRRRRTSAADVAPSEVAQAAAAPRVADITHLYVHPSLRAKGVGSALVNAYEQLAKRYGVEQVDLVTLPADKGGAGPFYERLGWSMAQTVTSRSGEEFLLYQKPLVDPVG